MAAKFYSQLLSQTNNVHSTTQPPQQAICQNSDSRKVSMAIGWFCLMLSSKAWTRIC